MFDLAWSEIALIGVVALVVIGPKDLPEAIRGVARGIAKLRRMASEFQGQADELVREANLDEVRNSINEIRNFNIRGEIEKHIDADGSLRKSFTEDPLKDSYGPPAASAPPPAGEAATEGAAAAPGSADAAGSAAAPPPPPAAPAFVPPAFVPPAAPPPMAAAEPPPPTATPAFVPPAPAPEPAPHIQKT
ncbi:Sec-independent protein translocase protein TatB [Siccirubricoccus phaeus]|uniref:Sec-independent protein translocase protein TatB n=1 Tax=Siccirubricoccus phaeus TaxID=2595053 RepID=UPI00165C07E3|nr:Sec-independent protein translocase protein TatB [Siccirubricoccus phaeus]